jgi:hypothetical protein
MEQSTLFTLSPIVDKILANVRVLEDLPDSSAVDADLASFRKILERLRDISPTGPNEPIDGTAFEEILDDFDAAIDEHVAEQSAAQDAIENVTGASSEAVEWAAELQTEFDDAEFEAAWAEVDRARAMMQPTFNASLDCPACHRASIGLASDGRHDERCPARPARVAAPRAATPPTRPVAIDPATGLPPRPQTHREVMGRLYSLSERRPAASVPCTKCRTGAGKRHGKGCTAAGARAR